MTLNAQNEAHFLKEIINSRDKNNLNNSLRNNNRKVNEREREVPFRNNSTYSIESYKI